MLNLLCIQVVTVDGKVKGKLLLSKAILLLHVMVVAVCLRSRLQFLQRQLHLPPRPKLSFVCGSIVEVLILPRATASPPYPL